ncbi:hypothetical protein OF83DRAFT_691074 [Amylostereum chailletii]|nr:hypothetical protein OF83DRAFT_691074 [Amylostereum chailletii]
MRTSLNYKALSYPPSFLNPSTIITMSQSCPSQNIPPPTVLFNVQAVIDANSDLVREARGLRERHERETSKLRDDLRQERAAHADLQARFDALVAACETLKQVLQETALTSTATSDLFSEVVVQAASPRSPPCSPSRGQRPFQEEEYPLVRGRTGEPAPLPQALLPCVRHSALGSAGHMTDHCTDGSHFLRELPSAEEEPNTSCGVRYATTAGMPSPRAFVSNSRFQGDLMTSDPRRRTQRSPHSLSLEGIAPSDQRAPPPVATPSADLFFSAEDHTHPANDPAVASASHRHRSQNGTRQSGGSLGQGKRAKGDTDRQELGIVSDTRRARKKTRKGVVRPETAGLGADAPSHMYGG